MVRFSVLEVHFLGRIRSGDYDGPKDRSLDIDNNQTLPKISNLVSYLLTVQCRREVSLMRK